MAGFGASGGKTNALAAVAGFGALCLVLLVRCSTDGKSPDVNTARSILSYLKPNVHAVAKGGLDATVSVEPISLESHDCWREPGQTRNDRRFPKPVFFCVLKIVDGDGITYATTVLTEFIPKSMIAKYNGRRIDFADVGRYRVTSFRGRRLREILEKRAPEFFLAE